MTELFNMSWGLNLDKQQIRKKYNALNSAKRRKTISKAEHKHKAATMGEFKRLSLGTGGGEPYSPPTVDGTAACARNVPKTFSACSSAAGR